MFPKTDFGKMFTNFWWESVLKISPKLEQCINMPVLGAVKSQNGGLEVPQSLPTFNRLSPPPPPPSPHEGF